MVGGLRCVVIHVKRDSNRLRGYGAVGVENGPSLLLWPVAYTTACYGGVTSRDQYHAIIKTVRIHLNS